MPFEKVDPHPDFPALERQMLELWDRIRAFDKLKAKNQGKRQWSFLDGPITANNPMGVHHAWGRTYKDVYNRYFAMTGRELRYQQGFDCQGLWVEVEVEKELGLKSKRDIENLVPGDVEASVARFVQECKNRVDRFARVQTDQSIRLGYWMNWDRTDDDWAKPPDARKSYFTMSEENNYTIWSFLKKCHGRGLIYRGYDSMPWCGRCGVGISEMEMKEGYRLVEHRAAFIKLPLKGRPGENLLVWTTTPWTLTSNVGAAVNPELTYLKVRSKGEVYYVAKGVFKQNRMESAAGEADEPEAQARGKRRDWLDGVPHLSSIEQLFKSKSKEGYEIVGEVKGSEMIGWEYIGPFDDLPAQQYPYGFPEEVAQVVKQAGWCPPRSAAESHRVISGGHDVTETEGTGIVHTAPGCGQIDFVWGKENGLPPVAPIDDSGTFHAGFGELSSLNAAHPATADAIFDMLKRKDVLFATERYVHRYPHCWRCKTELLYRLVDEWFINMGPRNSEEGFRGEIMKVVNQVTFLPESLNGRARERDWLWNMGDWMISKKRYWGLALPIWVDEKDPTQFEVIGSRAELKERAVAGWDDFEGKSPHRPFVDRLKVRNPRTGNLMSRIPDVGNPWLDAGIVAFSTMGYNRDRDYWRQRYPADFITESFPGQFRNWFYALLAMSTMMADGEPPFKTLLGHGLVRDQFGSEMHKSEGNAVEFVGAVDDGYELFHDIEPNKDAKVALGELPKNPLNVREELVERSGRRSKRVFARYKPVGADVVRWFYSRANPVSNVNFGPEPTDEVRARFVIKLWNCYSFFCNYARLDGFDPMAPVVPATDRPDIDRWILSDLQGLVATARKEFEAYNVMAFCLEAERFVDDRLSNWYIRRNRGRFQSNSSELDEAGLRDKWAAHQTLYTVLTTLAKLCAPIVPFLAEVTFQNLRTPADPESVHLCTFPEFNESLRDTELSSVMGGLLRLVREAMNLRNLSKHKVRQPLATLVVQPGNKRERLALERFSDLLREEINVESVLVHHREMEGHDLLSLERKINHNVIRQWRPNQAQQIIKKIEAGDLVEVPGTWTDGPPMLGVTIDIDGQIVQVVLPFEAVYAWKAPEGWEKLAGEPGQLQLLLDARITAELKLKGLARDVIRQVQERRKNSGLNMEDRIVLYLHTESEKLQAAIEAHRDHIAAETLTVRWSDVPVGEVVEAKIEGQVLKIGVTKAS